MTNSEKAKELAFEENGTFLPRSVAIEKQCLKMAEWKDQQFKEYLEKNRLNFPDFMNGIHDYAFGMKEGYVNAFDIIKDNFFKED